MAGLRSLKKVAAVALISLAWGCDYSSSSPNSPSTLARALAPTPSPTPTPTPSPAPAPGPTGIANSTLSGVVFELSATGRTPLEGAIIYFVTCGVFNCPDGKGYEVKTARDGSYRIAGLYDGKLNFLWVSDSVYAMVDAMPLCPDYCDRVVTVSGETRLDIDLVRR